MRVFSSYWLLFLIALPCVITVFENKVFAYAEDATEEDTQDSTEDEASVDSSSEGEQTTEEETQSQGSPDIDLTLLFTNPEGNGMELPAGKPVEFLIGITNNGEKEYVVDAAEVSFKYPMDFTYTIQNFTAAIYKKSLKPKQEATVFYNFLTSDQFAGRPLGLQINLAYHDAEGEGFMESVFNSTINIIEVDEGLDAETFFLYVFLMAFVVLLLLGGHHVLTSLGVGVSSKGYSRPSKVAKTSYTGVETGSSDMNGVDYDWLPEQMKADMKKQANGSSKKGVSSVATRSSPRLRKI